EAVVPGELEREDGAQRDVDQASQTEAAERADRDEDQKQDERRPEVRLLQDEERRHAGEDAGDDEIANASLFALRIVVQIFGERDDEKQLHELARLKAEAADVNPARAPADVAAEDEDEEQKDDA